MPDDYMLNGFGSLAVKPGGESKIAIGSWWPAKQELDNIR